MFIHLRRLLRRKCAPRHRRFVVESLEWRQLLAAAPGGADHSATTPEDWPYVFTVADFGFSDPNDTPADSFRAVKIAALPAAGSLSNNFQPVAAGQFVSYPDIASGRFRFTPALHAHGPSYAAFAFQVQDDGGTASGGVDLDPTPNTITLNVTPVNDPPSGADRVINPFFDATLREDWAYTFSLADFPLTDFADSPADNQLDRVRISTLPSSGTLRLRALFVAPGEFVSKTEIASGQLVFVPLYNANSATHYSLFMFQVKDNGGTANGGIDLDLTPNTITINVTPVNDAPTAQNFSRTIWEDSTYTFSTADWGFYDPSDYYPPNTFLQLLIPAAPSSGTLLLGATPVTAFPATISIAHLSGNQFRFMPAANSIASVTLGFRVQDDGGTAYGGVDTSFGVNTVTFTFTSVNDRPFPITPGNPSALEDNTITYTVADFGFSDATDNPVNTFLEVRIVATPANGTLLDGATPLGAGTVVSTTSIGAGNLRFVPRPNANGSAPPYDSFIYTVRDNGGIVGGGADTSLPATMSIVITPVNDWPSGQDRVVGPQASAAYTFSLADFPISDANDTPANSLAAVRIVSLPTAGALTLNGVLATPGQYVPTSGIAAGLFQFTPTSGSLCGPSDGFSFQVHDNGGTLNGGVDLDPVARLLFFRPYLGVVNQAPSGIPKSVSGVEDVPAVIRAADFGFVDIDEPPNQLRAVRISSLPARGSLQSGGMAVAIGQFISASDIVAGRLSYSPPLNASGPAFASFTFQAQDDGVSGGCLGSDLDPIARTLSIDVGPVNDPPSFSKGADQDVTDESGPQSVVNWAQQLLAGPPDEAQQKTEFQVHVDQPHLFAAGPGIDATGQLTFTPAKNAVGTAVVSVFVSDDGGTANGGVAASGSETFVIRVAKLRPQHNARVALDVDDNRFVSSGDALAIINYLNSEGSSSVVNGASPVPPYYDVSGEGFISPGDALMVINHLNAFGAGPAPAGEGESSGETTNDAAASLAELIGLLGLDPGRGFARNAARRK